MISRGLRILSLVSLVALSTGCATKAPPYDYSGFMTAKPTSLLVLPPTQPLRGRAAQARVRMYKVRSVRIVPSFNFALFPELFCVR